MTVLERHIYCMYPNGDTRDEPMQKAQVFLRDDVGTRERWRVLAAAVTTVTMRWKVHFWAAAFFPGAMPVDALAHGFARLARRSWSSFSIASSVSIL